MGIPVDQEVLQNAGIESCDALVAVTNDDNVNIMVSQMALEVFKVPRVVASIVDPSRETVFSHFGIRTICPTRLTVDTLYSVMIDEDEMCIRDRHEALFRECDYVHYPAEQHLCVSGRPDHPAHYRHCFHG